MTSLSDGPRAKKSQRNLVVAALQWRSFKSLPQAVPCGCLASLARLLEGIRVLRGQRGRHGTARAGLREMRCVAN